MRVARVSTVSFFVISQLRFQVEYLEKCGADVTVISDDDDQLGESNAAKTFKHFIRVRIARKIAPLADIRAIWSLYWLFRKIKFDVVHSTTPKAGLLCAIAAWLAGVPVRLHTFTGQAWVELGGPMRWVARRCDWLIGFLNTRCYADSESQRRFIIAERIVRAEKIAVAGAGSLAGVDLGRFNPERFSDRECLTLRDSLGIPAGVPVLLFVGRITRDKGIGELLEAFARLKRAGSPAHLVLVGPIDADSGAGGGISTLQSGQTADLHAVGFSACPESYMAMADVLCLPSYREGFGTVVIEAAAMGLATVGTNIYGLTDAIQDGETGLLVAPRDVDALADALDKILADDLLRVRLGSAARRRATMLFDADRVNAQIMDEYRKLFAR